MATHIDVLVGDYESCVRFNAAAIQADLECIKHIRPIQLAYSRFTLDTLFTIITYLSIELFLEGWKERQWRLPDN